MQLISKDEILKTIFDKNNLLAIQKVNEMIPIQNENLNEIGLGIFFVAKFPIPHFKICYKDHFANDLTDIIIKMSEILTELSITFHLLITNKASEIYVIPRKHQCQVVADIEKIQGDGKELKKGIFPKLGKGAYELCGNCTISDEKIFNSNLITTSLFEDYLKIYAITEEKLINEVIPKIKAIEI